MDLTRLILDAQADISNYIGISLEYKKDHDRIFIELLNAPEKRQRMIRLLEETEGKRSLSIKTSVINTVAGFFFTKPELYMQLLISPVLEDDFYFSEFVPIKIFESTMSRFLGIALEKGGCIEDDNFVFSVTFFQDNLQSANFSKKETTKCY